MKRVQLFEFEDLSWFPATIRRSMTNLLVVLHKMMGTKEVIANLLAPVLQDRQLRRVVDLGSGTGGVMPQVKENLCSEHQQCDVEFLLTDLYPNSDQVAAMNAAADTALRYHPEPVDATALDKAPSGLKTMINSFHHMRPEAARNILSSAQENRQPLLIYEIGENNMPILLWWILLPLSLVVLMIMVLFMTPFVRPLTWQQLLFTYIIPVIPICYAWDGQASLPRMYSMKDIDKLLPARIDGYTWEKGRAYKKNKKKLGTFILGMPQSV